MPVSVHFQKLFHGAAGMGRRKISTIYVYSENRDSRMDALKQSGELLRFLALSRQTTQTIEKLQESASEIGVVTDTIAKTTERTNLLALNATVEATSAWEAGRGFAVVAGEIKELARQSQIAAENIQERITGVQSSTGEAVSLIKEVADIIQQANHSFRQIPALVNDRTVMMEQIIATVADITGRMSDISNMMQEFARQTDEVHDNADLVGQRVEESNIHNHQVKQTSSDLSILAGSLENLINAFRLNSEILEQ
jgi:methyl-accepting chemotaxis protein